MKISIIIPAYNEELYIGECLKNIEKCLSSDVYEVIVVDNASTDKTAQIARSFSFVKLLTESKKGNSNARKLGADFAQGDFLAFIDADTRMPKDWIEKAKKEFENKNIIALSGPYIYYGLSFFNFMQTWIFWNIFTVLMYYISGSMVVFGNFIVKKEALKKIGGIDTSIAFYGDDANLARRLQKVGKVLFRRKFVMPSSGRRLNKEGIIKSGFTYALNFFSEKLFHTQATKEYTDVR